MKKILLLSDINSSHTQKWVISLIEKDFQIAVFSLSKATTNWFKSLRNFELFDEHGFEKNIFYKSTFQKIAFVKVMPSLKRAIRKFHPDIVHAHYASSYGLIGALSKFHPYFISVWGSDVFDFTKQNFINKRILQFNLSKADLILSTSEVMKRETEMYTDRNIIVIPFGIDLEKFKSVSANTTNEIIIGTIKSMEEIYGIPYLIRAFKIVHDKFQVLNLHLLLVGDGTKITEYKKLVKNLNLKDAVTFTGHIPYADVVDYHNKIDVFVAVSLSESFGVAVLEASACERPVVVSNIGGLPEVVADGVTGFIVTARDVVATADAIEKLILDKNLRVMFGKQGRKRVEELYNWQRNVEVMCNLYNEIPSIQKF